MYNDHIAILDIGTTKIVALVGQQTPEGKLHILGYGEEESEGVNRGLVTNVNEAATSIKNAVDKAKKQSGIEFKDVFVGIAGQNIVSHQSRHSIAISEEDVIDEKHVELLTKEVYNMALEPGQKILHVFPQEYMIDNQVITNPVGTMGKQLSANFHLSIGKERAIRIIEKCIEKVGLNIIKIILEPVASAEAVLSADEKEAGTVLVDIGGGTSDVIVFKNNNIKHTAVIPIGGKAITKDLHKGCKILEKQAEELKVQHGSAIADLVKDTEFATVEGITGRQAREISCKTVAQIIEARVIEIIDTIYYEVKNAMPINEIAGGITLTGGGALLKNIAQIFNFRTGLETNIAYPSKYTYSDNKAFDDPRYATAIGLMLKGVGYMEQIAQKQNTQEEKPVEKEQQDINLDTHNEENKDEKQESKEKNKKSLKNIFNKISKFIVPDDDSESL